MRMLITALLLLMLSFGMPVHAQGSEWAVLNDEVKSLYQQGRYDEGVVKGGKRCAGAAAPGGGKQYACYFDVLF